MKVYDEKTIKEFLSDPSVRPLLNWSGIEKAAGLAPSRIKNMVSQGKGSGLTEEERVRLSHTLLLLSIDGWRP